MIRMRRTTCLHPDFQMLIRALDRELRATNGDEAQDVLDRFNIITDIDTVVLVYAQDLAVACGCFKPFDNRSVEIKRMFVQPEHRGQGVAAALLTELEQWAGELGYTRVVLETGSRLKSAVRLYTRQGYERVPNWGPYIGIPESICMGKER